MTRGAALVYLALASEAPDADVFAGHAAQARQLGANRADIARARQAWHVARNYRPATR